MMTKESCQDERADTAGDWFVRLNLDDCPLEDFLKFADWVGKDEKNWQAYQRCQESFHIAKHLSLEPGWQLASEKEVPGETQTRPGQLRSIRRSVAAVLATALAAVLMLSVFLPDGTKYETKISEQRLVSLDDGSTVQLNTNTSLTEDYSQGIRRIILHQGEALFEVTKLPEGRPFVVQAGTRTVTALGTVFNVYQTRDQITVTVLEGKVLVEPVKSGSADVDLAIVNVGEELSYDENKLAAKVESPSIARIQSWRQGNLEFDAESLEAVVEEMNRYTNKKIVIGDRDIDNVKVSGKFRIGSSVHFVDALSKVFPIQVVDRGDHFLLLPG